MEKRGGEKSNETKFTHIYIHHEKSPNIKINMKFSPLQKVASVEYFFLWHGEKNFFFSEYDFSNSTNNFRVFNIQYCWKSIIAGYN